MLLVQFHMAFKFCLVWVCWRWKRALVSVFDLFYHKQHPCPPHVEEFLWVVVCALVWHGYGMNLPCFTFYYFCLFLLCLEVMVIFVWLFWFYCLLKHHILFILLIILTYFAKWLICHKNRFNCCFLKILKLSTKVVDVKRHIKNVLCLLVIKAW